jgi:hypothetical protein
MLKLNKYTFLLLLSITVSPFLLKGQNFDEFTIKGVMLEKFARFIEWPDDKITSNNAKTFVIYVYNNNTIASALSKILKSQRINNRSVIVHNISSLDDIIECNILFIPFNSKSSLSQILTYTRNKPILTISDTEGWCQKGVIINFFVKDNKIGFEINEEAVRDSKLYIGFRLLSVAVIVKNYSN